MLPGTLKWSGLLCRRLEEVQYDCWREKKHSGMTYLCRGSSFTEFK